MDHLINNSVGILGEVNERAFEQLPLYQMHVTVRGLAGTSVENVDLIASVVNTLTSLGSRYHDLRTEQPTLEDVFLKLTGKIIQD